MAKSKPIYVGGAYSRGFNRRRSPKRMFKKFLTLAVCAVVIAAIVYFVSGIIPTTITVDGEVLSVNKNTKYIDLVNQNMVQKKPGDYVAVDGSVLRAGEGEPVSFMTEGVKYDDLNQKIIPKKAYLTERGANIMESYTTVEDVEPHQYILGDGDNFNFYNKVLHVLTSVGNDGTAIYRIGAESGKRAIDSEIVPKADSILTSIDPVVASDENKVIALTFDDGPSPTYTQPLLEILQQYNVKATFFMLGNNVEAHPDIAKAVADAGHQVASHTYSHEPENYLNRLDSASVLSQIKKAQDAIYNATGVKTTCVRPPGGNINTNAILASDGYATSFVGWTVSTGDFQNNGTNVLISRILKGAANGAIVLLHDGGGNRSQTLAAMQTIIPTLLDEGYKFVTIDELIALRTEQPTDKLQTQ